MTTTLKLNYSSPTNEINSVESNQISNFMLLLKSKWDETHSKSEVFRYKINKLEVKILDNKYLLQLNPDRGSKRRTPQMIDNISQPFDINKFNFTKVSKDEVLFNLISENDEEEHTVIVNVSPISRYHSLLCPFINRCLPQIVTSDSLELALHIMHIAQDRDLKMVFNSLCAFASVNHLHYHLLFEQFPLPVQFWKCNHIKGSLYKLDNTYPVPAFCFEIPSKEAINQISMEAIKVIKYFLDNSIAHNILLTRGKSLDSNRLEVIRLVIWPRKSCIGVKQFEAFNVAACELSGWFPIFDKDEFNKLKTEDLEKELVKWKYEEFELLTKEVMELF